jgi:hypothetical protein
MFLTYSEQERADKAGRRAGATFDGLYDSTPPFALKHKSERHAQEWRDAYRKGFNLARRERGKA